MIYTGFADEAGSDLDTQIRATRELGWENIESRNIDGKNIHDISDEAFDAVYGKLQDAGIKINCFGSAIMNWAKAVSDPLDDSMAEAKRAVVRMKRLGTPMVRLMSFAVMRDRSVDDQMADERVRRMTEICKLFLDEGLLPVHENCANYGGMGWPYTLELVEKIPGMKLVFDTANPVGTPDYAKGEPYPRQSSWEFYDHVKDHIAYVHIKDSKFIEDTGEIFSKQEFTWPGEGDGDVKKIVADLLKNGYDGGFSIEPHLSVVFHDDRRQSKDDIRYQNYVEYGRRFMKIVDAVK